MDGAGAGGAARERRKQLTAADAMNHKRLQLPLLLLPLLTILKRRLVWYQLPLLLLPLMVLMQNCLHHYPLNNYH